MMPDRFLELTLELTPELILELSLCQTLFNLDSAQDQIKINPGRMH